MGILVGLATKYGMQILGALALIGVIVGGYYYIKHMGAAEQHAEDMHKLEKRNKNEQNQSDILLAQARADNAAIKAKNDETYIGILTNASQTIKITQFERDAAVSELLKLRQRVTTTASNNNTESGKANISETGVGRTRDDCEEISTAEIEARLEISRMAELSLLASGFIRQVADVK